MMVGIKTLIICFLALFVASNAARAETAHSVLQRYSAWRGGEAFKRLNAISEAGSFSDGVFPVRHHGTPAARAKFTLTRNSGRSKRSCRSSMIKEGTPT